MKKVGWMGTELVTLHGRKHYVRNDTLDLSTWRVTDIQKIEGLDALTNLEWLLLENNQITEITGLEELTNLKSNLNLRGNPIKEKERYLINESPYQIVRYCQEKRGLKKLDT